VGLIFSCAEGIRLLPFPPPAGINGAENAAPYSGNFEHLSYVRSADESRTRQGSDSRTAPVRHVSGGYHHTGLNIPVSGLAANDVFVIDLVRFHSAPARILPETRGPPVFLTA
jgi:hypothetical protein